MMPANPDVAAFIRLVEVLHPWLQEIVFVGGWAHRLYRSHELAQPLDYPPLMTRDADIALPARAPAAEENIADRLVAAGFKEKLSGEQRPPVTRYQLDEEHGGFYAEFVTPLIGSHSKRDGKPDATTRIAGVSAQKLRHVDLLLVSPWSVALGLEDGYAFSKPVAVRVPNAAAYVAQKILIHDKRRTIAERAKDLLYVHDTIEAFSPSLKEVRKDWTHHVKPQLAARARSRVEQAAETMFTEISDEVRSAARQAAGPLGRPLSPDSIAEVCRAGLKEIFA